MNLMVNLDAGLSLTVLLAFVCLSGLSARRTAAPRGLVFRPARRGPPPGWRARQARLRRFERSLSGRR